MAEPTDPAPPPDPDATSGTGSNAAHPSHGHSAERTVPDAESEPQRPLANQSSGPVDSGPDVISSRNVAWPRLARADDFTENPSQPTVPREATGTSQMFTLVFAQICGFGLIVGGYFLGQAWSPPPKTEPANAAVRPGYPHTKLQLAISARALEASDRALRAERGRDFKSARAIYEEIIKRRTPLPGAEYRLALVSLHEGDYLQAELHLNRSLTVGDDPANCYLLRATLAGRKGNFAEVSTQLASAVRAEPFNARLCFCWGESLRREGKLAEAIARLTQALDRPDNEPARALYLFKLRAAKLVEGNDEAAKTELADHLAEASPSGDWPMLAAVEALGRKDVSVAAKYLEKAHASLPPRVFATYVQDFQLQAYAGRQEISAFLNVPPPFEEPAIDAPLQDPAIWTAAEADPAVWPPFTKAE